MGICTWCRRRRACAFACSLCVVVMHHPICWFTRSTVSILHGHGYAAKAAHNSHRNCHVTHPQMVTATIVSHEPPFLPIGHRSDFAAASRLTTPTVVEEHLRTTISHRSPCHLPRLEYHGRISLARRAELATCKLRADSGRGQLRTSRLFVPFQKGAQKDAQKGALTTFLGALPGSSKTQLTVQGQKKGWMGCADSSLGDRDVRRLRGK